MISITFVCPVCKKEVTRQRNRQRDATRNQRTYYCSKDCADLGFKESPPMLGIKGSDCHNWKGGRIISTDGYIRVYNPSHPCAVGSYVHEAILILEEKLGRSIQKSEVVHHINHIRADNRLENLMVYVSQSEHILLGHPEFGRKNKKYSRREYKDKG